MPYALLFPGQGSQFVGMGSDLFDERDDLLGARADDVLGWSLRDACLNGPEERLTRTEFAQPALFALSVALWQLFSARVPMRPVAAAGHSLGEYSALVASGMLDFEPALAVVAARGRAMQAAADRESSGMAALLGADVELAEKVCDARVAEGGRLSVANINAPGQVVVAGGVDDLEWLEVHGRDHGVRRSIRLKVAGAFHSPFMAPAAEAVAEALAGIEAREGAFPVYSNVTAQPVGALAVGATLSTQVESPVLFSRSLEAMAEAGVDTFIHVGPGDVTAGMAKRSVEGSTALAVSDVASIDGVLEAMT
ncbi:MAG: ACP S-malonyltransferase [Acidimicrobiia bacterium]|nr:ACP S-malonyltransferase [Acidimicrobiia bacterium]MDH4306198.1 ACP S-malonyltransferase [Acidimicrobiia bacterium]